MLNKSSEKASLERKDAVRTSLLVHSVLGVVSQSQSFIALLFLGGMLHPMLRKNNHVELHLYVSLGVVFLHGEE